MRQYGLAPVARRASRVQQWPVLSALPACLQAESRFTLHAANVPVSRLCLGIAVHWSIPAFQSRDQFSFTVLDAIRRSARLFAKSLRGALRARSGAGWPWACRSGTSAAGMRPLGLGPWHWHSMASALTLALGTRFWGATTNTKPRAAW
jgi:hypothetical protein